MHKLWQQLKKIYPFKFIPTRIGIAEKFSSLFYRLYQNWYDRSIELIQKSYDAKKKTKIK